MTQSERAIELAIGLAKDFGRREVTADDLLLACLLMRSEFGIAHLGSWAIDLEDLGVNWLRPADGERHKVAYADDAVEVFDRSAAIARACGGGPVELDHLLAAFAVRDSGLMGRLRERYGITSAGWRAALAKAKPGAAQAGADRGAENAPAAGKEFLSPDEAAEELGVHVQTLRAYIRGGKLPAMRLAGERQLRIRRADLVKVLEPLVPETEG